MRWRFWCYAALLGVSCRIALYFSSTGTNDIRTWKHFAELFDTYGPYQAYRIDSLLNHPPLGCLLAWLSLKLSQVTNISFDHLFKFLPMVADIGMAGLLGLTAGRFMSLNYVRTAATYLVSIGAIEISCFHGNTDALSIFFLVLSAYLFQEHRRYFWGALSLSCAMNIKIIPMLAVPLFFITLPDWRSRFIFLCGLVPGVFLLCAGYYVVGSPFVINIFKHRSYPEPWGIPLLLSYYDSGWVNLFRDYGVRIMILAVSLLGVLQWVMGRPLSFMKITALTMFIFLIFAPGFGVQYIIYGAPFFAVAGIFWGMTFSIMSGAFTTLDYLTFFKSDWPIETHHTHPFTPSVARAGLVVWFLLIIFPLYIHMWQRAMTWIKATFIKSPLKNDIFYPND